MGMGGWEVLLILVIFIVLFGAKKIPEMARGLGKGIREFKDATSEIKDEIEHAGSPKTKPTPTPEEKTQQ